jgi:hypothetical protein
MTGSDFTGMAFSELLRGPLLASELPLHLDVQFCDLRPRFISKGQVGRSYRAIARNGRVLLATDCPLAELIQRVSRLRIQIWHRAILAGDTAEAYGLLLSIRTNSKTSRGLVHTARLVKAPGRFCELAIDVGGGMILEFSWKGNDLNLK